MKFSFKSYSALFFVALITFSLSANQGYYRYPDLKQDQLVFTAEGDIWISSLTEPQPRRLTTSAAQETNARISPDGDFVAYEAAYEGRREVYVIPTKGGLAKRVTYETSNVRLQGWTERGDILVASDNSVGPIGTWVLKIIDPNTLATETLPLAEAGMGAVDSINGYVYFARYGLLGFSDNAKVYRGGLKAELWRWKLNSKQEAERLLVNHEGDISALSFVDGFLYFVSDASGNKNIWRLAAGETQAEPVTNYDDWPVRQFSVDQNRLVYQLGADIKIRELSSDNSRVVSLPLSSDFAQTREKWDANPMQRLTAASINHKGQRVVLTARGQLAVAGSKDARLVQVTRDQASRNRSAVLDAQGKYVYTINDRSGELEIWRYKADGSGNAKQLTDDGKVFRYNLYLSPDQKWLAHDDANGDLWLLNLDSGANKKVLSGNTGISAYQDVVWSPDSKWIAFTINHRDSLRSRVGVYSLDRSQHKIVSSDKYESFSPTFDNEQHWLYFLSNRNFNPTPSSPWGDRNMGPMFDKRTLLFAYSLNTAASFPFLPSTETTGESSDSKKSEERWGSLGQKLWQVPLSAGNYSQLQATEKGLYVLESQVGSRSSELKHLPFEYPAKLDTFAGNVSRFQVATNREYVLVRQGRGGSTKLLIAPVGKKLASDTKDLVVKTNAWKLRIDPKQEWSQIFADAWLMHREFFFDRDMRGLDWKSVKSKYQPLVSRVTERQELNDIFAQMMGELSALHSQVRGGDLPRLENAPATSHLGARLAQTNSGVFIDSIYKHEIERPMTASPLAKPNVDANNGDKILRINGISIKNIAELKSELQNQVNQTVELVLERDGKTHTTYVEPVSVRDDYRLRLQDWTTRNQAKVSAVSDDIGYLHIAAMGGNDLAQFAREFYANFDKKGIIIDVRANRGGNIDSLIIEKLLRRTWAFWSGDRFSPFTNMQQTFRGHLVVLIDQRTYSDGETFSAAVKALDLAPLVGKQTAGAGVWLRSQNRQSDGGIARVAEFAQYAMDGTWILEGRGVSPTIEVDNLPYATFNGGDQQLTTAIKYLQDKIKQEPIAPLKAKPFAPLPQPAADVK